MDSELSLHVPNRLNSKLPNVINQLAAHNIDLNQTEMSLYCYYASNSF